MTATFQQGLMESFIGRLGLLDKQIFQNIHGRFLPISEWKGVKRNFLDQITEIRWVNMFREDAALDYEYLPPSLKVFTAQKCSLVGPVPLDKFPKCLKLLDLMSNRLSGSVDLSNLPEDIEYLRLSENMFSGGLDMNNLPKSLKYMYLTGNTLNGPLDLRYLPGSLEIMHLSKNRFSKDIFSGNLPRKLCVYLDYNPIDEAELVRNCNDPGAKMVRNSSGRCLKDGSGKKLVCVKKDQSFRMKNMEWVKGTGMVGVHIDKREWQKMRTWKRG